MCINSTINTVKETLSAIIAFMRQKWHISVIGRLLLIFGVIILLDITPVQKTLKLQFHQVKKAMEAGSSSEAARLTAEIARQIPWRSDLWEQAGDYAWQAGDYPSAIAYLEQASLAHNLSREGRLRLADAYIQNGKPYKAELLLGELLEGDPSSDIYIRLFQVHRLQKDYPAALRDMLALTEIMPENATHFYLSGLLQMFLQPEHALDYLQKASSLNDDFTPTVSAIKYSLLLATQTNNPAQLLITHGRILVALQEWELAGEAFRQATLVEPENALAWAFLGEVVQHSNGPASVYANLYPLKDTAATPHLAEDAGLAELQKAIALDPQLTAGHVFFSLYWERHQRFDLALTAIEKAIHLSPTDAALYSQKGSIQAMLGDLSGALASYQQGVAVSNNDPQALKLLLTFCITYEYQLNEAAFPAARNLLQQDLEDPSALDLAGQVLFLQKDPAAQRYLERALAQDANYAPAHLHLGLLYLQRGDLTRAREKFTLAQSLAPGTVTASQAQRLLETYFP